MNTTSEIDRLISAAVRDDVGEVERIARHRLAADALRNQHAVDSELQHTYARGFGPLVDLAATIFRDADPTGAAARRLDRWRIAQRANQGTGDTPGLIWFAPSPLGTGGAALSPLLDQVADRADPPMGSRGFQTPKWTTRPTAVVDPVEHAVITTGAAQIDSDEVGWHLAAAAVDVSRQVLDWPSSSQADLSNGFASAVNAALETVICSDLIAASTAIPAGATVADTLDAAESQAATWNDPNVIVLVSVGDMAAARRAYAGQQNPPVLVPTSGLPRGSAIAFARSAVVLAATPPEILSAPHPSAAGVDLAWLRYATASVKAVTAVAAATLPVPST